MVDADGVVARAREAGVRGIINIGIDLPTSRSARALAQRYPGFCHASAGIHPHEAERTGERELAELRAELASGAYVAVGEAGLDYFRDRAPREPQAPLFRAQIEMAIELRLPLVIHMRDALDDGVAILEEYAGSGLTGVMHCFAGDERHAARCLEIGLHVSFAGPLTFKKADEVRAVAKTVPLERTLLETDSPFLAPQPIRGKTNEPAAVRWVAEKQAEIRGLGVGEVVASTTASARSLFGVEAAA